MPRRLVTGRLYLYFAVLLTLFFGVSFFSMLPPPGPVPSPVGPYVNDTFSDYIILNDENIGVAPAFPNITFNTPLTWSMHPNQDTIFVGQQDGKIYYFENDENVQIKQLFFDYSDTVGVTWDAGLLGLAFHPNFGLAGEPGRNYFYLYYTTRDDQGGIWPDSPQPQLCRENAVWNGGYVHLSRFEVMEGTLNVIPNSELLMFKLRHYGSSHYGGGLTFGQDGFLYLSTGDQTQFSTGQLTNDNLDGGVLRLDVDMDPALSHPPGWQLPKDPRGPDETSGAGYWIPNDNPFVGMPATFEEYYAIGLRNPHRMTMDRETGIFYLGDVGSLLHEEINEIEYGQNYGWPIIEGDNVINGCTDQLNPLSPAPTAPLVAFPRSEANSIMGGYVYRGQQIPALYGKYICADYGVGNEMWLVDIETGEYELLTDFWPGQLVSFGEDHQGEIYLLKQGNKTTLFKLAASVEVGAPPATLSQTGLFEDLQSLTPKPYMIPYEPIESFWSDGAEKQRWMVLPNDGNHNTPNEQIRFSEDGEWVFPEGSVLVKHFEMQVDATNPAITKRLETRVIVIGPDQSYYGVTYKWRDDQQDADLLESSLTELVTINSPNGPTFKEWYYPSRTDCNACHIPETRGTLGVRTRYLNRNYQYNNDPFAINQLVALSSAGILDRVIQSDDPVNFLTSTHSQDLTADLQDRALSYLDLNCGYCHRPSTGNRAVFDAQLKTPFEISNFESNDLNEALGLPNEHIVLFGDTLNSALYQRLHSSDPSIMMPPLAKNLIDAEGAELIAEWILGLDENTPVCSPQLVSTDKAVRQSSVEGNSIPELAIDGVNQQGLGFTYRALTEEEQEPWWEINLGGVYSITDMTIGNFADCLLEIDETFFVFTSVAPLTGNSINDLRSEFGVHEYYFMAYPCEDICLNIGRDAQYIRIIKPGISRLSLTEVEIFGCLTNHCGQLTGQPCDDGNACTINDVYDVDCQCAGTPIAGDADGDGVCDQADMCDGFDDNLYGTICSDADPCTVGDLWGVNCGCEGIYVDSDNDGTCDALETEPYLQGAAELLEEDCFLLTPASIFEIGAFWMPTAYNLSLPTEITFDLYLGNLDENGADGVALIFQQHGFLAIGGGGGELGIPNITPALVLEFDTWEGKTNEIPEDHLTLWQDGGFANELVAAVCMDAGCSNTEDGATHSVRITWDPVSMVFEVYFDEALRIFHVFDMIEDVFSGQPEVYIGMTGATGGAVNDQYVCNFSVESGGLTSFQNPVGGNAAVLVYPNPFTRELTFHLEKQFERIRLVDVNGRVLDEMMLNGFIPEVTWNLSDRQLADGLYFIQFIDDDEMITRKVIKSGF